MKLLLAALAAVAALVVAAPALGQLPESHEGTSAETGAMLYADGTYDTHSGSQGSLLPFPGYVDQESNDPGSDGQAQSSVGAGSGGGAGSAEACPAYGLWMTWLGEASARADLRGSLGVRANADATVAQCNTGSTSSGGGNVHVRSRAVVNDTVTLSAPATVTVRVHVHAVLSDDARPDSNVNGWPWPVRLAGSAGFLNFFGEGVGIDGFSRSWSIYHPDTPLECDGSVLCPGGVIDETYSAEVALPEGDSSFSAQLEAESWVQGYADARAGYGGPTSSGQTGTVDANDTLSFEIVVPDGVSATSASGLLPIVGGAPATEVTHLSIDDVSVQEGDDGTRDAVFTISRSSTTGGTDSVWVDLSDGTATAGDDYVDVSGLVPFAPGATTAELHVPIVGDTTSEDDETFTATLTEAANAHDFTKQTGTATIVDDDAPPVPEVDMRVVSVVDSPDPVVPGKTVTYTVKVVNDGPGVAPWAGVIVEPLNGAAPALTVSGVGASCDASPPSSDGKMMCLWPNVAPGTVLTATATVKAPSAPATLTYRMWSTFASAHDVDLANNTVEESTQVTWPPADLAVAVTDTPDPVVLGGTVTYTITVTNKGPSPVTTPAVVTFGTAGPGTGTVVSASAPDASAPSCGDRGNGHWSCGWSGGISVNGTRQIVVKVTAPTAAGSAVLGAGIDAASVTSWFDPIPTNDFVWESTTVAFVVDSLVTGMNLATGTASSLIAKVNAAKQAYTAGNLTAACGSLGALRNEASAQAGKKLTAAQAQQLLATTSELRVGLSCP